MHRLTLTFDNGPTPGVTEGVLDILAERGLRATFFCVGNDLLRPGRRELAERAHAEGHWHGNHTLTHSVQFGRSGDPGLPEREIGRAQGVLGTLSHADRFFRPWGDGRISRDILSERAIEYLRRGGYTLALWDIVPRDWEDPDGWADRALEQVAREEWPVLVVHDQPTGAMGRLEYFLDALARTDVEIVQELPSHITPIRRGEVISDLSHLYRAPAGVRSGENEAGKSTTEHPRE